MRIGIDLLSEKGTPGGVHTYVNELIPELAKAADREPELRIEYVVFAHASNRFHPRVEAAPRTRIVRTGWRRLPAAARRLSQEALAPRMAREHRIDLLHSINNVLPRRAGVPAVLTVHDLSPFAVPGRFGRLKERYLSARVPESILRAERVIAVSRSTRADVITWIPDAAPARVQVVPLAAGAAFSAPADPREEERLRAQYRLPERFALHVSLVEPGKNLESVSRALAALRARGVSIPLVIAGAATSHLAELERLWRQLGMRGDVHYLGRVPGSCLPALYRAASLFIFPSHHEGFGLPVLEAFTCGTPVITSTRSALPEVAGDAALLVPPRDVAGLARSVEKVWRDEALAALLRSRGIRRAREFSWERCARATLAVHLAAAGRARSAPGAMGARDDGGAAALAGEEPVAGSGARRRLDQSSRSTVTM